MQEQFNFSYGDKDSDRSEDILPETIASEAEGKTGDHGLIEFPTGRSEILEIHNDDDEDDCPLCGGSGPCYACERGRRVVEEFKQAGQEKRKKRSVA